MEDISQELKDRLKRYYLTQANFESTGFMDRDLSVADKFVQLSLQSQLESDEGSVRNFSADVSLSGLFAPAFENEGAIRKILITGQPGVGKSTLCHKLACEWASGMFSGQFEYVFWISLASLNIAGAEKKFKRSLSKWIAHECFDDNDDYIVKLRALLKSEAAPEQCLFVLDGFDEVSELFSQRGSWQKKLLKKLFTRFPNLIITSRTNEIPPSIVSGINRHIVIQGFSEDNIQKYISILFKANAEAKKSFLLFLSQRPVLSELLKIPINLFLLSELWQLKNNQRALQFFKDNTTLVGLYETFCMAYLRSRDEIDKTKSIRDLDEMHLKVLSVLGKAACRVPLGQRISGNELVSVCREGGIEFHELLKTELLIRENIRDSANVADYSFPHQTFQEYFAARYITQCLMSSKPHEVKVATDWILEKKYNPNYVITLGFISGLLSKALDKDSRGVQAFYDALLTTRIDWVGLRHVILMIHVLEHYDKDSFVTPKKRQKILDDILMWFEASIKSISSGQHFQQLIQRKLREVFSQCPNMANFCLKKLSEKWEKERSNVETKMRVVCAYIIPLANILDDPNKLFFINLLKAHKYESNFYAMVLASVEWSSFRHFPAKEKWELFAMLRGLFRDSNIFLRLYAVFALVEMALETDHQDILSMFAGFNTKNPAFLMALSVAIGLLKNNFEPELLSRIAAFMDNPDASSAKAVDDLKVLTYAVRKCEKVKAFDSLRSRLPNIHSASSSASRFQKKPEYSEGATILLRHVEEHGVAIVGDIGENKCHMVLCSELVDETREKSREEMLSFLTSLQDFLAPLGLSSRGYEYFVALQKPRYAQSSKRGCGVSFFQGPAVQTMGLTPYLTVNHAKFRVAHSAEKAVGLPSEFLITRFDRRWRRCELLPVDVDAMSFDIVEPQNILFMSERHAAQIDLVHKDDPRRRINELNEALIWVGSNEELGVCRYLDLSGNKLDDTDLFIVCDSDVFKNLHCLILSNNTIGYEGLRELLDTVRSLEVPLKYIILNRNFISFKRNEFETINKAAKTSGIVYMDLSLNFICQEEGLRFGDRGLNYLQMEIERQDMIKEFSKSWRFNFVSPAFDYLIPSIIKKEAELNSQKGVVALLKQDLHWRLGIEYIDAFSQRVLIVADLIVRNGEINIKARLCSLKDYEKKKYSVVEHGNLEVAEITEKLLPKIFRSQNLQGFLKYKQGKSGVKEVDCLGWVEKMLGEFGIHVRDSRVKAALSLVFGKSSPSSRK